MKLQLEKARKLEAEAKAIRREAKEFWAVVDANADEVIKHFGLCDKLQPVADMYGITVEALIEFISSDSQVSYYKRTHASDINSICGYAD